MVEHYIGIDLHKAFFQACAVDLRGARCWEERFVTSRVGVAAFLSRTPANVVVGVEASGPTWSFVDRLHGNLARVVVVDAAKTRLKAGYAAKTDRLDARRLADALRRDSVATIYYPPPAIRELRELCRYRRSLVRIQTGIRQRVQALLLRHGVVASHASLWHGGGARWFGTLRLGGRAGESLTGMRQLLTATGEQVKAVDAEVAREAAGDPIVVALQTLPGIGPVLGLGSGPKSATSPDSRTRPIWRVTRASSHGSPKAGCGARGLDRLPSRARVVAVGARRSGHSRRAPAGPHRTLGAAPGGAERRVEGTGGDRPRLVRRDFFAVWPRT